MDLLSLTKTLKTQAAIERNENSSLGFLLSANGQVESGDFKGDDNLYVKYDLTFGQHWEVIDGVDKGISQIAVKSEGSEGKVVWNFPISVLFKSLNAHGWPRLVLSVFGIDSLGRDVARGYGSIHLPTRPGVYTRTVRLFRPVCSSYFQQFVAWLRGTQPEFYDSRFVAKSEGREVTRVESVGTITVQLNIMTRGMETQGYEDGKKLSKHVMLARMKGDENSQQGNSSIGPGSAVKGSVSSGSSTNNSSGRPPLESRNR